MHRIVMSVNILVLNRSLQFAMFYHYSKDFGFVKMSRRGCTVNYGQRGRDQK